jgi:hypothetical protein
MDIWQSDKLMLFLVFFIPGFISIKIYDLLVPAERRDFSKSILEVIGYSSLNFAVLSWLIILMHTGNFYDKYKVWYFILLFCIMFVIPILWPIFFLKLFSWKPIAKYVIHPILKPWDYLFGKKEAFWVIVHLKDGRKIAGRFDTKSFASSYPAEEQIYIEEIWSLDKNDKFEKPIQRSQGILILKDEIMAIEFFK